MNLHPTPVPFDLQKFRDGDVKIFDDVFNSHKRGLYNMALWILDNTAAAEDVVAEVCFRLWMNKDTMNSAGHVKGFLFKSARNLCLDEIQGTNRGRKFKEEYAEWIMATNEDSDTILLYEEIEQRIHGLMIQDVLDEMEKMPSRYKEAAKLYLFREMSMSEVADQMGVTLHTARTLWKRAKKLLQEGLKRFL